MLTGLKPDYSNLQPFGSVAYSKTLDPNKLKPQSEKCRYHVRGMYSMAINC